MKKIYSIPILSLLAIAFIFGGCKKEVPKGSIVKMEDFPKAVDLPEGKPVEFDSVFGMPGSADIIGDEIAIFLYNSDYNYAVTDKDFKVKYFAVKKGEGPDEFPGWVTSSGDTSPDGQIYVFDNSRKKLMGIDDKDPEHPVLEMDFGFVPDSLPPKSIFRLSDDKYIYTKRELLTGIVECNPKTKELKEWPKGLSEVDHNRMDTYYGSMHKLSLSPDKKIIAEFYAKLPYIILRNDKGEVERILQYGEVIEKEKGNAKGYTPEFCDVILGKNNIIAYHRESPLVQGGEILVFDYEGNPVAKFKLPYGQSISIDSKNKRIIAVDPNEEPYMMVYDLPEGIKL